MEEVPENIGPVGIVPLIHWLDAVFSTISKIPLPLLGFGLDLRGHKLVELSSGADASFLNLQTFLPDSCSDLLASESQECFLEYTSAETSKCVNYSLKSQSFTSKKGKITFLLRNSVLRSLTLPSLKTSSFVGCLCTPYAAVIQQFH